MSSIFKSDAAFFKDSPKVCKIMQKSANFETRAVQKLESKMGKDLEKRPETQQQMWKREARKLKRWATTKYLSEKKTAVKKPGE